MAAVSNTPVLGVDITSNESTNKSGHKLGTRISVSDNGEAVYVQAGSAITQYHTVGIDENFAACFADAGAHGANIAAVAGAGQASTTESACHTLLRDLTA